MEVGATALAHAHLRTHPPQSGVHETEHPDLVAIHAAGAAHEGDRVLIHRHIAQAITSVLRGNSASCSALASAFHLGPAYPALLPALELPLRVLSSMSNTTLPSSWLQEAGSASTGLPTMKAVEALSEYLQALGTCLWRPLRLVVIEPTGICSTCAWRPAHGAATVGGTSTMLVLALSGGHFRLVWPHVPRSSIGMASTAKQKDTRCLPQLLAVPAGWHQPFLTDLQWMRMHRGGDRAHVATRCTVTPVPPQRAAGAPVFLPADRPTKQVREQPDRPVSTTKPLVTSGAGIPAFATQEEAPPGFHSRVHSRAKAAQSPGALIGDRMMGTAQAASASDSAEHMFIRPVAPLLDHQALTAGEAGVVRMAPPEPASAVTTSTSRGAPGVRARRVLRNRVQILSRFMPNLAAELPVLPVHELQQE